MIKEIKTAKQILSADKKTGKNDFMSKLVKGVTLEEIEQYNIGNKGMEFSLDQLYTSKLEEIIEQKFINKENKEDIIAWLGLRMSARKVDNLLEIHQNKNPDIDSNAK